MAAPLAVHTSRFALLKIDDEDDDDGASQSKKKQQEKKGGQAASAKKRNKKKKKNDSEKAENAELRNIAFGKGSTSKPKSPPATSNTNQQRPTKGKQWDEWCKMDEEFTSEVYEKDLQQAMLMSKLEFEEHKEFKDAVGDALSDHRGGGDGKKGKKKKKEGPKTMSLDEFNQMGEEKPSYPEAEDRLHLQESKPTKPTENDSKFFDKVDQDVNKIILKEKIQEEYRKQYVVESAQVLKYQEELGQRDKTISELKEVNAALEAELKQVKKRNQQLCHILAQGEMKEKVDVLMELEELRQVKDELTQEVTSLTSQLEKERSRGSAKKQDHDRPKGGKHGK